MAPPFRTTASTAVSALLLLLGAGTSTAGADISFKASMEPSEVAFLELREIRYRLRMTTGALEERFRVRVMQPRWDPVFARGAGGFPAAPDCFLDPLVLEGPGRLSDTVCLPRPARGDVCERGSGPWELSGEVTLPPRSTSTLVARFLRGPPPLSRTDYRATFAVGVGRDDTLTGVQRIQPPKPAVRGPFGTHITISTRPRTPYFRFPAGRRFRPGQVIDIRGRTEPALRGRRVALRYRYIPSRGATPLRTLARPEVGPRGLFSHRGWRPRRRGAYRLYAAYEPRGRHRTLDESCSRGFAIRVRRGRHSWQEGAHHGLHPSHGVVGIAAPEKRDAEVADRDVDRNHSILEMNVGEHPIAAALRTWPGLDAGRQPDGPRLGERITSRWAVSAVDDGTRLP
jgi:hypothetical protein